MSVQEVSSDIIVVHQNRIIFSSGEGALTQHSKISAQVTQVLTLFSQKIMKGEQIHFIRFENHRMVFLSSQYRKEEGLTAIVLIPLERSARQIIPAMNIVLRMVEKFLQGDILDAQNHHLDTFYQILTSPKKSFIVIPRTSEGILTALVILTAFAHDLRFGIQEIISKVCFVNPNDPSELNEVIQKSRTNRILAFTPLPGTEENDNVLVFGLEAPLRQYFSAFPGEKIYDVIGRIFGDQSNAAKMRRFVANEEASEIAQSVSLFPKSEDDFIRNEVLLSTVLRPGKDVIVTMSTPVMQKLRTLTTSAPGEKVSEVHVESLKLEDLTHKLHEVITQETTPAVSYPESEFDTGIDLTAEPDAVPKIAPEFPSKAIEPILPIEISEDVLSQLNQMRKSGYEYRFDSIPLVLDTAPFEIRMLGTLGLSYEEAEITISLFSGGDEHFSIHVYTVLSRLPALKNSLEDLSIRIGGESHLKEDHVSLEAPIGKLRLTLRAILWLCVVEYLTQAQMKIQPLSNRFDIPREGSILIIPPKRDFIREKIPSKFKTFVEESQVRSQFEQEPIWTLGKTQDEIISLLMNPLKQGEGVVFVASEDNQEMEEVALFLLLISELCGIGFSRW